MLFHATLDQGRTFVLLVGPEQQGSGSQHPFFIPGILCHDLVENGVGFFLLTGLQINPGQVHGQIQIARHHIQSFFKLCFHGLGLSLASQIPDPGQDQFNGSGMGNPALGKDRINFLLSFLHTQTASLEQIKIRGQIRFVF